MAEICFKQAWLNDLDCVRLDLNEVKMVLRAAMLLLPAIGYKNDLFPLTHINVHLFLLVQVQYERRANALISVWPGINLWR